MSQKGFFFLSARGNFFCNFYCPLELRLRKTTNYCLLSTTFVHHSYTVIFAFWVIVHDNDVTVEGKKEFFFLFLVFLPFFSKFTFTFTFLLLYSTFPVCLNYCCSLPYRYPIASMYGLIPNRRLSLYYD